MADETTDLKSLDAKALVKEIKSSKFSQTNVDATIEALARAGIPVYLDVNASEPMVKIEGDVSPLRFLEWQVRSMALEVSTRGGSLGKELDELYPVDDGFPAISSWIGAYTAAAPTPGGEIAREIMGKRNWKNADDAPFPMIVSALFASDLIMEHRAAEPANASRLLYLQSSCGGMQEFVDDALANTLETLNRANGAEPGTITSHTVEELTELGMLNPDIYDAETAEVLRRAREVAMLLAIAAEALTLVKPWSVRVGGAPKSTRFGVGEEINQGEIYANVDFGGTVDWPADLLSCASAAGVSLPPLSANEAPINWEVTEKPIPLINFSELPDKLDDGGAAAFHYITNNESEETAKGTPQDGRLTVKATVQRDDLAAAGRALISAIFNKLFTIPSWSSLGFAGRIGEIQEGFEKLSKGTGMGVVTVVYHVKEEKKPEGLDKKLFGDWLVTDVAAALTEELRKTATDGPEMYFEGQAGTEIYHFGKDGVVAVTADGFTAVGGSDDPYLGHTDVGLEYNGTAVGTYTADGDSIDLKWEDWSGMSGRLLMSINGAALPGGDVGDPSRFFPTGAVPYEISGKTLKLWMYGQNSVPILLTRM